MANPININRSSPVAFNQQAPPVETSLLVASEIPAADPVMSPGFGPRRESTTTVVIPIQLDQ